MNARLPQEWFDRAREDLQVARLVLRERHYPDGVPGGLAGGQPGETEALEALNVTEEIFRFVATQLSWHAGTDQTFEQILTHGA